MDNDMNSMNNDMNADKPKKKRKGIFDRRRFAGFLDRQGFYVVLFICICVIGITALVTTKGKDDLGEEDRQDDIMEYDDDLSLDEDIYMSDLYPEMYPTETSGGDETEVDETMGIDDSVDIKVEDVLTNDGEDGEEGTKAEMTKGDDTQGQDIEEENIKPVISNQEEEKPISGKMGKMTMIRPVVGDTIILDYAQDELVYSSTLKEWRTHPGIDIECQLGSEVRAALNGVVQAIEEDSLMGITIILDHGGGLSTKYSNLSTKDMVQIGQHVVEGQVISGVGRTAVAEILDPPHLHFEVMIDGKNVDPNQFFE